MRCAALTCRFRSPMPSWRQWNRAPNGRFVFPQATFAGEGETILRDWPGFEEKSHAASYGACRHATFGTVYCAPRTSMPNRACSLSIKLTGSIIFGTANGSAPRICGEIPLPPYGACDLGSINLTRFVSFPF